MIRVEQAALTLPEGATGGHQPRRPSWECSCGEAWPCAPAREQLVDAYRGDRIGLAVSMGIRLASAVAEIPPSVDDRLYERFLGWMGWMR